MITVKFLGPDEAFFNTAFSEIDGASVFAPAENGFIFGQETGTARTTVLGSGFVFNETFTPIAGTVEELIFRQDAEIVARIDGLGWDWIATAVAVNDFFTNGDPGGLNTLFNLEPILFDARTASTGFSTDSLALTFTQPIEALGSRFDDVLGGSSADDSLKGRRGDDDLSGQRGDDTLLGSAGKDKLNGGAGDDLLKGQAGKDRLIGGAGDDEIEGNGGNDRVQGGAGDDTISGAKGNDNLSGGAGDDDIGGAAGNDRLNGNKGNDNLVGLDGDDTITGGGGNDRLVGGEGFDALFPGTGDDTMNGGADVDDFLFYGNIDEGKNTIFEFDIATEFLTFFDTDPSEVSFEKSGGGTLVTLNSGTEIQLVGAPFGSFSEANLVFFS